MATITFACGTPFGGALDSTASLAAIARQAGHDVQLIVATTDPYTTRPRLTSVLVRISRLHRSMGRLAWRAHDRIYEGTEEEDYRGFTVLRARDVPAAVDHAHGEGGLIVVNSVRRLDLERLIAMARRHDSRTVWYVREVPSLVFAATLGRDVAVLLANSRPLAQEAERVAGRTCAYIPSVIPRSGLVAPTDRTSILLVNPIESHGLELALCLADLAPDRRFVLQESWPLGDRGLEELRARAQAHPNVEVRPRADRSRVYTDARIMIAPHSAEAAGLSRPRVALESQFLGVPMVAANVPGLASVSASPELLVAANATPDRWIEVLDLVDRDYVRYCREAQHFADGELPSAEKLWARFASECNLDR